MLCNFSAPIQHLIKHARGTFSSFHIVHSVHYEVCISIEISRFIRKNILNNNNNNNNIYYLQLGSHTIAVVILQVYKYMKRIANKFTFKSGGPHEKHVVATWNLGNHLSILL
jgi:hypothetical protein